MKPCTECPKYSECTELCDRAEKYVDQDHIAQREVTFTEDFLELLQIQSPFTWPEMASFFKAESVNFPPLTPLQNKILHLFYFEGLSYREIARAVSGNRSKTKINQSAVDYQLRKARAEILRFSSTNREI